MVDDHPSMIEGYKSVLLYNTSGLEIETTTAFTCKKAFEIIKDTTTYPFFDMVFLDRSMPPFEEQNINSGEDLALLVRQYRPDSKIIMLTSHVESFILYAILKNINPEGLLVKSDFDGEELLRAFDAVQNGATYHSVTVRENIQDVLSNNIFLDTYNRQILSLIVQGVQTKNIATHLPLSVSSIEKRKAQIKEALGIKGNDETLILQVRKMGLV